MLRQPCWPHSILQRGKGSGDLGLQQHWEKFLAYHCLPQQERQMLAGPFINFYSCFAPHITSRWAMNSLTLKNPVFEAEDCMSIFCTDNQTVYLATCYSNGNPFNGNIVQTRRFIDIYTVLPSNSTFCLIFREPKVECGNEATPSYRMHEYSEFQLQ